MTPFEFVVLLAVFLFVALVFALLNPPGLMNWMREELRLAREETWADGIYQGPGTGSDPRVAAVAEKQRELAEKMRVEGRHLLAGRAYKPELTKPLAPPPRASAVITPIRARGANR